MCVYTQKHTHTHTHIRKDIFDFFFTLIFTPFPPSDINKKTPRDFRFMPYKLYCVIHRDDVYNTSEHKRYTSG
jgi:hypothetical protein